MNTVRHGFLKQVQDDKTNMSQTNNQPKLTDQELLQKIYDNTEKMRKYILWQRIFSWAKISIVVLIIILSAIYLPPLVKNAIQPYQELLNINPLNQDAGININELMKMYQ